MAGTARLRVRSKPPETSTSAIVHVFDHALRDDVGEPDVKASESASKLAWQGPPD